MAVSAAAGVEYAKVFKKSVNIDKFIKYAVELKDMAAGRKLCFFMDNLSVHRSKKVLGKLDELGIRYIFNLSYSPQFNPIELTFSKVK